MGTGKLVVWEEEVEPAILALASYLDQIDAMPTISSTASKLVGVGAKQVRAAGEVSMQFMLKSIEKVWMEEEELGCILEILPDEAHREVFRTALEQSLRLM